MVIKKTLCGLGLILGMLSSWTVSANEKQIMLDELVEHFHKHQLFSGVVTASTGDVQLSTVIGMADRERGEKLTVNHQLGVGSVSKTYTAALVLVLVERGKLELDQKLSVWFPELKGTKKADITVRQLLLHRSGLVPHFRYDCWIEDNCREVIKEGKLTDLILNSELAFKPGEDRLYGNASYYLVARVIEGVTQMPFSQALFEYVLKPLNLSDTFSRNGKKSADKLSLAYVPAQKEGWTLSTYLPEQMFLGGAGIVSTAKELERFQTAVFDHQLFSAKTFAKLVNQRSATPWSRIKGLDDWYIVDGQLKGESTIVAHNPVTNSSIQILSNQGTSYWHKRLLMLMVMQIIEGQELIDLFDFASFSLQKAAIDGDLAEVVTKGEIADDQLNGADVSAIINQFDWADAAEHAIQIALYAYQKSPTIENQEQLIRLCDNDRNRALCFSLTTPAMQSFSWEDKARMDWQEEKSRPLLTQIFYPSFESEPDEMLLANGMFSAGKVALGGAYWGHTKRPLILLSHGTGGTLMQHLWLVDELTNQGYIVAGVNHHGNTGVEQKYQSPGFILWWERAMDLQVLMTELKSNPVWSQRIDFDKVAVAGFSLGGYTAMSVAGAKTNKQLFYDFCRSPLRDFTCEPQLEFEKMVEEFNKIAHKQVIQDAFGRQSDSFKITELKGAFAIAPGVAQSFIPDSLKAIDIPVRLVVGDRDRVSPGATNSAHIDKFLPNSVMSEVAGADHYSFLSQCTPKGVQKLGKLCESSGQRPNHHSIVAKQAVAFFKSIF